MKKQKMQQEVEDCRKKLWEFAEHHEFTDLQKMDLLKITQRLYKVANKRTWWQRIKHKFKNIYNG